VTRLAPEVHRFRAAERWILRRLRRWLDAVDDAVHGWEVRIREEIASEKTRLV
jgi:hypothetical protein